jgi:hypothetical protein
MIANLLEFATATTMRTIMSGIPTGSTPDRPPRSLTGRLIGFAVLACALVGVVYVCVRLPSEVDMHGDSAFIALALYAILGGMLCSGVGLSVGLSAAVGNYLAAAVRPTDLSRYIGVSVATGSSAALSFCVLLIYAGIDDLDWLIVVLAIVLPAVLCLVVQRWSRAMAAYESRVATV